MRTLILGATGRTGTLIVCEALHRGLEIRCLVRSEPKAFFNTAHKNIELIEGNPSNSLDLREALTGCDQVISALNVSRHSDFPWSRLRSPKTLMSDTIGNLISLSDKIPIRKLVICSAWGVGDTKKDIPVWFRWMIKNSNIGPAYEDHERQENLLQKSNLKWTIVRPVGLVNGEKDQLIIESFNNTPKPRLTINRKTVAHYMINALDNPKLDYMCPVISAK